MRQATRFRHGLLQGMVPHHALAIRRATSLVRPLPYSLIQSADVISAAPQAQGSRVATVAAGEDAAFVLPHLQRASRKATELDKHSLKVDMILPSPVDVPRLQVMVSHTRKDDLSVKLLSDPHTSPEALLAASEALKPVKRSQFAWGLAVDLSEQLYVNISTWVRRHALLNWDAAAVARHARHTGGFAWPVHWVDGEPHVLLRGFTSTEHSEDNSGLAEAGLLPDSDGAYTSAVPIGGSVGRREFFEPIAHSLARDLGSWVEDWDRLKRRPDPQVAQTAVTRARLLGIDRLADLITDEVLQDAGVSRAMVEAELDGLRQDPESRFYLRHRGAAGLASALREAAVAAAPPLTWLLRRSLRPVLAAIPDFDAILNSCFPAAISSRGNVNFLFGAHALEQFFDFHQAVTIGSERLELAKGITELDRAPAAFLGSGFHKASALRELGEGFDYDGTVDELVRETVERSGMHRTWEAVATATGLPLVPETMRHLLPADASAEDVCATSLRGRLEIGATSLHWVPVRSLLASVRGHRTVVTDRLGQRVLLSRFVADLVHVVRRQFERMLGDDSPAAPSDVVSLP